MTAKSVCPRKPHFFQPLLPGCHNIIPIPGSFFKHLNNGQKREFAVLRSNRVGCWRVKIKGRHLEDGWTKFARDHELQVGDFLVFRHEGDMVFDVMVFDPSACEVHFAPFSLEKQTLEETKKALFTLLLKDLTHLPSIKAELSSVLATLSQYQAFPVDIQSVISSFECQLTSLADSVNDSMKTINKVEEKIKKRATLAEKMKMNLNSYNALREEIDGLSSTEATLKIELERIQKKLVVVKDNQKVNNVKLEGLYKETQEYKHQCSALNEEIPKLEVSKKNAEDVLNRSKFVWADFNSKLANL